MIPFDIKQYNDAKPDDLIDYKCSGCQDNFKRTKKGIQSTYFYRKQTKMFCSLKCLGGFSNTSLEVPCVNCGKVSVKKLRERKTNTFCSNSCSATFNNKNRVILNRKFYLIVGKSKVLGARAKFFPTLGVNEFKKLLIIKNHQGELSNSKCTICDVITPFTSRGKPRLTCSSECKSESFRRAGKKSAAKQSSARRSLNEIAFFELCKTNFKNVIPNLPMFNGWDADVVIPNLKIAILWNGKWHYQKITQKHSLKQVQNRDNIKIKEIIKAGYRPYIVKDMGKYSLKFVKSEFDKFLIYVQKLTLK